MICKINEKKQWIDANRGEDILEQKIVITMDDDEPIKKEVVSIIEEFYPAINIFDVDPEIYPQIFTEEKYAFAPPGVIFFANGEPVWRSDLGILDLSDNAWNKMILHNMIRKFFMDKEDTKG